MKSYKNCYRGFSQLSKAWYGKDNLKNTERQDLICLGYYSPEGGNIGEIAVEWVMGHDKFIPKIRIFSDAWDVLGQMHDLIDYLAKYNNTDPDPDTFCRYLLDCGFKDVTETERDDTANSNTILINIKGELYEKL